MEPLETQGNFMSYEGESRRAAFALEEDLILFEAAPDLLKALKDLLASLEYIDFEHLDWVDQQDDEEPTSEQIPWELAKKAIAKATPEWVKETN